MGSLWGETTVFRLGGRGEGDEETGFSFHRLYGLLGLRAESTCAHLLFSLFSGALSISLYRILPRRE